MDNNRDEVLPVELWLYILSFLPPTVTLQASLVNKRWNEICNTDYLWKSHYGAMWPTWECSTGGASTNEESVSFLDALNNHPSENNGYKEECKKRVALERHGWMLGNYTTVSIQAHPVGESLNKVKFVAATSSGVRAEPTLLTCSDDKTVKIWKASDIAPQEIKAKGGKKAKITKKKKEAQAEEQVPLKCEKVMRHEGYVFSLDCDGNRIVSGDFGENVKVWNMQGHEQTTMQHVQAGGIYNILLNNNLILTSGIMDASVNLSDIESGKMLHRYTTPSAKRIFTISASFQNNVFVSAGVGRNFFWWDLRSREVIACVAAIPTSENTNLNEILRLNDNNHVAVGESEGTVKIWDLRKVKTSDKPEPVHVYQHGNLQIRDIWYDRGRLISACRDGTIKIWNRATHTVEATLPFPAPWTLQADERVLVAGNREGELRIFDFGGKRAKQEKSCSIQ